MSNSRTRKEQRLEHFFSRARQDFAALTQDVPRAQILVMPLDVGKNLSLAAILTLDGTILVPPFNLRPTQADFAATLARLDALLTTGRYRLLLHGHEPTGIYHLAWARTFRAHFATQLADADPALRVRHYNLNPRQVKQARQQAGHLFHKDDWLDLAAIFDLLSRGLGLPAYLPGPAQLALSQEIALLRGYSLDQQRTAAATLALFDQLVPGALSNVSRFQHAHADLPPLPPLVRSKPLSRAGVQLLITHLPDPYAVLAFSPAALRAFFHEHGLRCGLATAQHILAVYQRAPLPPPELAALLAGQLGAYFADYQHAQARSAQTAARLEPLLAQTPARHLLALPGASPLLVGRYLAASGSVSRFLHADQIWKLAGLEPSCYSSGDLISWGEMSKDGDAFLRGALYQLGFSLAMHCPYFGATFLRARERGKSLVQAVIHTAHKVNRVFFTLLSQDVPFAPPEIADYAAFCREWQPKMAAYFRRKHTGGSGQEQTP
jgi:transposase